MSNKKARKAQRSKELTQEPLTPVVHDYGGSTTGSVLSAPAGTSVHYTPDRVQSIRRALEAGQSTADYIAAADAALRDHPTLRSVLTTRVLALVSLPRIVTPTGTKRIDKQAADACRELSDSPQMKRLIRELAWAVYPGWGGAEQIYDELDPTFWPIERFSVLPPQWFVFDKATARVPYLLPAEPGGVLRPLEPRGRYVFHAPQILPGSPLRNGIAFTAIYFAMLVQVVLRYGTAFLELYGMPMRLGRFPKGNTPEHQRDRKILRRALENLGADAWAMIPQEMQIEFLKDATVTGSIDVYEKWSRYFDELLAKLVLGASLTSGTGNTGSGGSQALGQIHDKLRTDLLWADAEDLADTIREQVFAPFVELNFGPHVAVPSFSFQVEEPEDTTAWVDNACKMIDRGLPVPLAEAYARLNIREPAQGEATLGGQLTALKDDDQEQQGKAGDDKQALSIQLSEDKASPDAIDAIIADIQEDDDFVVVSSAQDSALLAALEGLDGASFTAFRDALLSAAKGVEVDVSAILAAALTAAKAGGNFGGKLGG